MKNISFLSLVLLITLSCSMLHRTSNAQTSPDPRLAWWQEARFGMFIHWGPVSLKGTEIGWSRGREVPAAEYDQLYKSFNPEKLNLYIINSFFLNQSNTKIN